MKSLVMLLATAIATVATIAASQEASPTPPPTPAATETAKSVTTSGEIVRYGAGRTIVVRTPDGHEVTYAIAPDISAPAEVTVGRRVSIVTEPSAAGPVLVTRITTDSVTLDGQVKTTTEKTEVEPSGAETKTQTTTVYGTVTAYEPGRSISLLGPSRKTVTYTIDSSSALPTGLAAGKTVVIRTITRPGATRPLVRKVTYSTTTTMKKKKG